MRAVRPAFAFLLGISLVGSECAVTMVTVHATQRALPEEVYTCPMHADIIEARAGNCPICKMKLDPVRIEEDFWYACPIHPVTLGRAPGLCPLDRRQKMPVVVTVHWVCDASVDQKLTEPGTCADGSRRREVHQIRAHGDHNPRHGGQFYMAADNWHHVEGTYPSAGVFRVYFYDNFTQPIDAKGFTVRLVGDGGADLHLKRGSENAMEAALADARLPLKLTLKVKFNSDTPESQFDFVFTGLSHEPVSVLSRTATVSAAARAASPSLKPRANSSRQQKRAAGREAAAEAARPVAAPATTLSAPIVPVPAPAVTVPTSPVLTNCEPNVAYTDVAALADALPKDRTALLTLLSMCQAEVQKLIEGGQFGVVYQPTMLGKDIALALEDQAGGLPVPRRLQVSDSVRRVVLSAWQLDLYGDLGNQAKLTEAYRIFAGALAEIDEAYGTHR